MMMAEKRRFPDKTIFLKGDARAPYGAVRVRHASAPRRPRSRTSCSAPKKIKSDGECSPAAATLASPYFDGDHPMAMDVGGKKAAPRRHQRHAAHRRRARAAHHLHGADAVDAEAPDRDRAQEGGGRRAGDAAGRDDHGRVHRQARADGQQRVGRARGARRASWRSGSKRAARRSCSSRPRTRRPTARSCA